MTMTETKPVTRTHAPIDEFWAMVPNNAWRWDENNVVHIGSDRVRF